VHGHSMVDILDSAILDSAVTLDLVVLDLVALDSDTLVFIKRHIKKQLLQLFFLFPNNKDKEYTARRRIS